MSEEAKVAVYELRSEEERESMDDWLATVLPVEADWEFRNEVQNHMDPGDLVMVRGKSVDIFQRKVLYEDPVKDDAPVGIPVQGDMAPHPNQDPFLRLECLRVMDGDVERARAAFAWVNGGE